MLERKQKNILGSYNQWRNFIASIVFLLKILTLLIFLKAYVSSKMSRRYNIHFFAMKSLKFLHRVNNFFICVELFSIQSSIEIFLRTTSKNVQLLRFYFLSVYSNMKLYVLTLRWTIYSDCNLDNFSRVKGSKNG